jgi:hypothetical protein
MDHLEAFLLNPLTGLGAALVLTVIGWKLNVNAADWVLFAAWCLFSISIFRTPPISRQPIIQKALVTLLFSSAIGLALSWLGGWKPAVETAETTKKANSKKLASLRELFENDWPNLPGYYADGAIEVHSRADNKTVLSVNLSWRLNGDFVARSTFLALFFEQRIPPTDALNACIAIADSYGWFINDVNAHISMSGQSPDDTSPTYLKNMVFSRRIFIYYENPDFSLAQKGTIETVYKNRGLSGQFRDAAYAWLHREDHLPFRANPLVSNSVLLPDGNLYPGLKMSVANLTHQVNQPR